jgi:hypothetical protein
MNFLIYCLQKTKRACIPLFTLMIPVSIVIRIVQQLGWLPYLSDFLEPVMQVVGLPAETALVWLTAMAVNIYGSLLVLFTIYPNFSEPMTVAQMTVLLTMILIAHTFPIELGIVRKTGVRMWIMFLIRFVLAIVLGFLLSKIYTSLNILQENAKITTIFTTTKTTWQAWGLNELKNYAIITLVIFSLVTFIRLLEIIGFLKVMNKSLEPILKWLGMSSDVLPLVVAGLTVGIAYGGGLLIAESKAKTLKPKEIFYSITLMGLFHSIFEDTLLMLSMGGHWSGVFVFRAIFAFVCTFLIVRIMRNMEDAKFLKYFMTKSAAAQTTTILSSSNNSKPL